MAVLKYTLLIVVGLLVVSAQQADSENSRSQRANAAINKIEEQSQGNDNATIILQDGYENCIDLVSKSEQEANDGISAAEKVVLDEPSQANQLIHQAFQQAKQYLYIAGTMVQQAIGEALAASNDGAIKGLKNASELVQNASIGLQGGMIACEPLLEDGNYAGGNAGLQMIKALRLCIATGFAGGYEELVKSHEAAVEGVKRAEENPINVDIILNFDIGSAENDPDASAAIRKINEIAENATLHGTRADLFNLVRNTLVQSLRNFAQIAAGAREDVSEAENADPNEEDNSDSTINNSIGKVIADIYLVYGRVGREAGSPSDEQVQLSIGIVEKGKAEVTNGNSIAAEVISIAQTFEGEDVQEMGYQAGIAAGRYGKKALFQRIVQSAEIFYDFLVKQTSSSNV